MLTIERIRKVVTRLGRKYDIKSVYLFGSYAKNTATVDSDVDLIIDMKNLRTYKDYFHFCDELETVLGVRVDVTSEEGMYPDVLNLVKKERILLYDA